MVIFPWQLRTKAILSFSPAPNSLAMNDEMVNTHTHSTQKGVVCVWINSWTMYNWLYWFKTPSILVGRPLTAFSNVWKMWSCPSYRKVCFAMETLVCIWTCFESDYMSYESCEQTVSCYGPKLTWKLWKSAVDEHHIDVNVWLITMGVKMKYQWVN